MQSTRTGGSATLTTARMRLWKGTSLASGRATRVVSVTTALYRRYRPDSFASVVGQEHVTTPLMQALRADRVNHAYLFSGPRGCGKTTSARILARCLNCEQGPTDVPCGTCASCVELATGGAGSVDVVEIDAASHNGVDDARELRERAAFAPARDRYKIFILDEAHMVTPQGFNALLKLVEEPPPHIRFIFATTEPEKVIGTIRSRTHHYPFRLVPPPVLTAYLQSLCESEGVTVAGGVLPLVVRAGGGSVRDSLSVLDQLMAGSDDQGVTYERAISLLGFTDATLLDDAVDAIAAADGASLFDVVARVMATGHEPRRFVEDLLERLRDLLVLCAAGAAGARALGDMPDDQRERITDQARRLGLARGSLAADLVNEALTRMVGATSPRLHLELLCARLLAAEPAPAGAHAYAGAASASAAPISAAPPAAAPSATVQAPAPASARPNHPAPAGESAPGALTGASAPARAPAAPAPGPTTAAPTTTPATNSAPAPAPVPASATGDTELVRRRWPEVLGTLERRRVTWTLVSQNAQVSSVDDGVLTLAFDNATLAAKFSGSIHSENVALAVRETLGLAVRVEAIQSASRGGAPANARPAVGGTATHATAPAAARASAQASSATTTSNGASADAANTTTGTSHRATTGTSQAASTPGATQPPARATSPGRSTQASADSPAPASGSSRPGGPPPWDLPPAEDGPASSAPSFKASSLNAPPLEAPPLDSQPDNGRPYDGPPYDGPPYDAPPDDEPPYEEDISEDDARAVDAHLSAAEIVAKELGGTIIDA